MKTIAVITGASLFGCRRPGGTPRFGSVEIRDLGLGDLDAAEDIRRRSFGPMPADRREIWDAMQTRAVEAGRVLAAYADGTVVGMARIMPFRQWWGGRSVPLAGIGGVVIAPEFRGRGIGTALMSATVARAADQRFPLSALYPATVPPYRAVGYELAGARRIAELPTYALRGLWRRGDRAEVRRAGPGDEQHVVDAIARVCAENGSNGPFDYDAVEWESELADPDFFGYLADDGFVGYGFDGSDTLFVQALLASSQRTLRTLWSLVGSGSSIATRVRACIGPADPVYWLLADPRVRVHQEDWWMLRVLDAPAAVEGRGFPAGVAVEVALALTDALVPDNHGGFRLRVADGHASLVRADVAADPLALNERGLAAMFAGTPLRTLRQAGLASGGTHADDTRLDAAFVAQSYMTDYF
jgi:predicted acetyltransferase